jgi:plasmid stabilization system protein ParE
VASTRTKRSLDCEDDGRVKRYRVELSPEALEQAQAIRSWWIENRPAAPDLFVEELGAAIRKLGAVPRSGARYQATTQSEMRRVLMPRTRYHVYYTVDDDARLVRVHTIWHMSRGQGPL